MIPDERKTKKIGKTNKTLTGSPKETLRLKLGKASALENNKTQTDSPKETLRLKLGKASALENNKTQTESPKETLRLKLGRASALENIFIRCQCNWGGPLRGRAEAHCESERTAAYGPFGAADLWKTQSQLE